MRRDGKGAWGIVTVEVVPPVGPHVEPLIDELKALLHLPFDAFSVATNPLARPRLSALVVSALVQERVGKPAILHVSTRDWNRLGIHSVLAGARAMGIETVLATSGDSVALNRRASATPVHDMNVFALVRKARDVGLHVGVVLDPGPRSTGFQQAVRRLERKVEAGAEFVVTQPIYEETDAELLYDATQHVAIPKLMGILPLHTARHAEFLHRKVAGIVVPKHVRERVARADDVAAEGVASARRMLAVAGDRFDGVCIMPPFNRYEVLFDILETDSGN